MNLQPAELRIGNRLRPNHILDPENIPLLGYSICAGHIAYSEEQLNYDWEPIPISAEILIACGFAVKADAQNDDNKWHCRYYIKMGNDDELGFGLGCFEDWFISGLQCPTNPQYLHQLQNLHFALTGSELEIK
jgi:hypothetical protein